jgi:hypothetical protein
MTVANLVMNMVQIITPVTAEEAPTPAEAFGDASEAPAPVVTGEITSLSDITHVPPPDEHASYAAAIKDTVQSLPNSLCRASFEYNVTAYCSYMSLVQLQRLPVLWRHTYTCTH